MRATVMYEAGDVRVEDVPDAKIVEPTDALIRVTRACICGSDLHPYHQMERSESGTRMGHEAVGVVVDVGFFGNRGADGAQAEAVRVPYADGTLFKLPVGEDDALMPSLLTLSDVMGTGHHAAVVAGVGPGKSVAVVGDGAVERVRELTGGFGAHSVLECVGYGQAVATAIGITRPGGAVGRVGVPQDETIPASLPAFFGNVTVGGGPAPVRAYIEDLLPDVLEGRIEPGRVFDRAVDLDGVPEGYRAMDEREAIKVMVRP